jgi:hypothetical protein
VSLSKGDRVLVGPLGVKGTVERAANAPGRWLVTPDNGGQAVSWHEKELEKLTEEG